MPPRIGNRVLVTVTTLAPEALPESGCALLGRYSARYGDAAPDRFVLNGDESMRLA